MRLHYTLFALLLALPTWAVAQESAAIHAARAHFQASTSVSLAASDVSDLAAVDQHVDSRSGATMVYMTQRHNGIPVYGSVSAAAVTSDGKVIAVRPAFLSGVASRTNATVPAVDAVAAAALAEQHVSGLLSSAPQSVLVLSDDAATDNRQAAPSVATYDVTTPELVYALTESGELRLAWSITLSTETGLAELWAVRVDALTGIVLAADDLVARHAFASSNATKAREGISFAPIAPEQTVPMASLSRAGSYRVIPWPNESPNHGAFAVVSDPANATASPNGWHNTGGPNFTITRGNNSWAYEDRDDTNGPTTIAASPDGGAGLNFDFPFDPALDPEGNLSAAITNLFYWTNIFHDVTYFYGFDEAAGNFQSVNFTGQGNGGDFVRAEAQDKAGLNPCPAGVQCSNNANFSTPADGGSGRMQMYEWTSAGTFDVTAPAGIAGPYPVAGAAFGLANGTVSGTAVAATGTAGLEGFSRGCTLDDVDNAGELSGKIALFERGDCDFVQKARTGEAVGAIAVVIYNCLPGAVGCSTNGPGESLVTMALPDGQTNDVNVIARFVQRSTGVAIRTASSAVSVDINVFQARDSDMDAGVILHEHAHGISNRLTGGRTQTGCLGNAEQMGEGWSDYYGLMLTMKATDTNVQRRGVATYLEFEETDGVGIRNEPYSTDFAVNDYTYQDVIDNTNGTGPRALSQPHGVGFVWASTLWEMTWELIGDHGYDQDIYNASGTAGNQIALNLVTMGLKLQPCSPGFVDGRDAILAADQALYGGAHLEAIWAAFARRGLGANASQGSSASTSDGTADFTVPTIATQTTPTGGTVSLTVAGPNPFRTSTAVALAVDTPQDVVVELYDLLGRRVSTLFDGTLAADVAHEIEVGASDLPSGVYVVRATGDTFSLSERVTVAR